MLATRTPLPPHKPDPRHAALAAQQKAKWQADFAAVGSIDAMPPPRGHMSRWMLMDGRAICKMTCVGQCGHELERTCEFFHTANQSISTLQSAGQDFLCNSSAHPCRMCYAMLLRARRKASPRFYLRVLMHPYKKTHAAPTAEMRTRYMTLMGASLGANAKSDGGVLWFYDHFTADGHCRVTGVPYRCMVLACGHPWSPGINEIKPTGKHGRNDGHSHDLYNIEIVLGLANVQQRGQELNWLPFYEHSITPVAGPVFTREDFEHEFVLTPTVLGFAHLSSTDVNMYDRYRQAHLLKCCMRRRIYANLRRDASKNRLPSCWTVEMEVDLYLAQGGRCAISGIPRHPRDLSLDRIDDTKGHCQENVRLVDLAFQSGSGHKMTRARYLHILLNMQEMVEVPAEARGRLQAELDGLVQADVYLF